MFSVLFMCILNVVCLFVGIWVGQKINKDEEIKIPNPIQKIKEYEESKKIKKEQQELNIMLENINNYDGSGLGQKDIEVEE